MKIIDGLRNKTCSYLKDSNDEDKKRKIKKASQIEKNKLLRKEKN